MRILILSLVLIFQSSLVYGAWTDSLTKNLYVCPNTNGFVHPRIYWNKDSEPESNCIEWLSTDPNINVKRQFLSDIPRRYQKVQSNDVVEMTASDKTVVDNQDASDRNASLRQRIIDRVNNDPLMRVILEIDFKKENQLRALHSMPAITRADYLQRIVDEALVIFP